MQEGTSVPRPVYIADIRISDAVAAKIRTKHNVTPEEVRETFILREDIQAGWEDHHVHGRRVVAFGHTGDGRPILAALYPVDPPSEGIWNLGTARSPRA